jgi:hypothetical protein
MDFFLTEYKDTSEHGTKSDPKGTFKLCLQKKSSPKNQSGSMFFTAKMIFMKIG